MCNYIHMLIAHGEILTEWHNGNNMIDYITYKIANWLYFHLANWLWKSNLATLHVDCEHMEGLEYVMLQDIQVCALTLKQHLRMQDSWRHAFPLKHMPCKCTIKCSSNKKWFDKDWQEARNYFMSLDVVKDKESYQKYLHA